MKNLNELSKKIHESNKLRGFDVSKDNIGQSLMLIVTEISEAMDAHQRGRFASMKEYSSKIECLHDNCTTEKISWFFHQNLFEKYIKNTFEDELADIVIRTLDYCAAFGVDVEQAYNIIRPNYYENMGEWLLKCADAITAYHERFEIFKKFQNINIVRPIKMVEKIAERECIDLEKHIALKLRYNETRPYKLGKLY